MDILDLIQKVLEKIKTTLLRWYNNAVELFFEFLLYLEKLANGKYVGDFKDDMFNGKGTYTFADGTKYVGYYENGVCVKYNAL